MVAVFNVRESLTARQTWIGLGLKNSQSSRFCRVSL